MMSDYSGVDPNLLAELRPGEQIRWWGRPDPRRRVINNRSRRTSMEVGVMGGVVVILLVFDVFLALTLGFADGGLLAGVVFINLALFLLILRFAIVVAYQRQHERNLRNTLYAITDQRALIMTVTPGKVRGVVSYAKSDIGTISRHEGKEGWGDLIFGVPRPSVVNGRRLMASASFGGIPQVRVAESIMFQTFKQADASTTAAPKSEQF